MSLLSDRIEQNLQDRLDSVRAIRALFNASGPPRESDFNTFVEGISPKRSLDIVSIQWAPRVSREERKSFEEAEQLNHPGFMIWESDAERRKLPVADRPDYFPVLFIHPPEPYQNLIGFDPASNIIRKKVIDAAIASGELIASPPIRLVQDPDGEPGLLVYLAVFERERVIGLSIGVFRMMDLIRLASQEIGLKNYEFLVEDATDKEVIPIVDGVFSDDARLSFRAANAQTRPPTDVHANISSIAVANRSWRMTSWPTRAYLSQATSSYPRNTMLMGFALTMMAALLLYSVLGRAEKIERNVAFRTRESEEMLRQVTDNIRSVFWISDAVKGQALYVSPAFEEIWGRTPEEMIQSVDTFYSSLHPDDLDRIRNEIQSSHRPDWTLEYRIIRPDGTLRWIETRSFPVRDENGSVTKLAGISEDITRRKLVEEALRESNERFDLAARGSDEGLWDGKRTQENPLSPLNEVYYSPRFKELLGFEDHEFPNVFGSVLGRFHEEDLPRVIQALQDHFEGRTPFFDLEARIRTKVGEYRWFSGRGQAIFDHLGSVTRMAGSLRDVTETKQAEENFHLLAAITELSADAISTGDIYGKFTSWNKAAQRIFGFTAEEVLGRHILDFFIPSDRKGEVAEILAMNPSEPNAVIRLRTERLHKDGRRIPVMVTSFPLIDEKESCYGRAGILQDLSLIVSMEKKLVAQSRMAAIGSVVAGIAHEIRNPLFGISAAAQVLARETDNAETKELSESMLSEIKRLNTLVTDLLIYAKPPRLERSNVVPKRMWDDLRDLQRDLLRSKNLLLEESFLPENAIVKVDEGKIRQVFLNLLLNAVQASNDGSRIKIVSQVNEQTWSLSIWNTGSSISPEHIGRIFEPFFSTKSEGSGLGLAVCQKIIEEHGGTIQCHSSQAEGTTFQFTLPVKIGLTTTTVGV